MDPTQQNAPEKPAAPRERTEKPERVPIKSLRTYQGDVEEALHRNNYSTTTVFLAEEKKRKAAPRAVTQKPINLEARNKLFTVVGIALVFLGALAVAAVYYTRSNEVVVVQEGQKTLIEASSESSIASAGATRATLISQMLSDKNSFKQPVNSILFLDISPDGKNPEDIQALLPLIGPTMPQSLARSFGKDYMFGVISYDTNAPFIVLTVDDYASSYAGMLKWEKTMAQDLGGLFEIPADTGTSTEIFLDEALRNKDLRILQDNGGKTILLYSFIDKQTLLITKNENVFNAILAKYLTSKTTR